MAMVTIVVVMAIIVAVRTDVRIMSRPIILVVRWTVPVPEGGRLPQQAAGRNPLVIERIAIRAIGIDLDRLKRQRTIAPFPIRPRNILSHITSVRWVNAPRCNPISFKVIRKSGQLGRPIDSVQTIYAA